MCTRELRQSTLGRALPNPTAIAQQWYQLVDPGIVDQCKTAGPIELMGLLLARVKSVSIAGKI